MKQTIIFFAILTFNTFLNADCIVGAKDKLSYIVVDDTTLVLKGGVGYDILVRTTCSLSDNLNIKVLKDRFCDYDEDVVSVDSEACGVELVKGLY